MFVNNFFTDNFFIDDFWTTSEPISLDANLILSDGYCYFPVLVEGASTTTSAPLTSDITPVQYSWGGLIRLSHNFPYIAGDIGIVQYKTSEGATGELDALTFDDTTITSRIPENILDDNSTYCYFNIKVTGIREAGEFSIQSEILTKKLGTGISIS